MARAYEFGQTKFLTVSSVRLYLLDHETFSIGNKSGLRPADWPSPPGYIFANAEGPW